MSGDIVKVKFNEGYDVAYKNNLYQPMTVQEIVYRKTEVPYKEKEDGSGFETKPASKLVGLICTWFDKDGKFHKELFHSRVLVPWSIAEQGAMAVHNYLNAI